MNPGTVEPLIEPKAISYITEYGIPYPEHSFVTSAEEAARAADRLGYPVVLKVVSLDVVHKSDVGGVSLGLEDSEAVLDSYKRMKASVAQQIPGADFRGAIVCEEVPPGLEVIVGGLRDTTFGPSVMFGLGGVFAEVLEDATFRVVPLKPRDAREMITEIRGYPLLKGARGQQEYAIDALVELIMTLSAMMAERPEIEEMDLNPVRVFANGLTALDARILVRRGEA